MSENTYRPIRDYGLIGDAHTAALVSSDGSIDWLCWPRFDSPAVFCRLLDGEKGGHFRVGPAGRGATSSRAYVEGTNVLATVFTTGGGRFRLTDLMPVERLNRRHEGEDIASHYHVLRSVEGLSGEAEVEVSFRPTFDFARAEATFHPYDGGILARGDGPPDAAARARDERRLVFRPHSSCPAETDIELPRGCRVYVSTPDE